MHPSTVRSPFRQLLRDFIVGALLLGGVGVAISFGSSALELVAMR